MLDKNSTSKIHILLNWVSLKEEAPSGDDGALGAGEVVDFLINFLFKKGSAKL